MNLTLSFRGEEQPQLYSTTFLLRDEQRCSYRGKTSGAFEGNLSFQWSPAVIALCALFAGSAHASLRGYCDFKLAGESNSAASSLDYALSKKPCWLLDMFGVDSRGSPIASQFLKRTNPQRRRLGPVVITLNNNLLPGSKIKILYNDELLDKADQLEQLLRGLLSNWDSGSSQVGNIEVIANTSIRISPSNGMINLKDSLQKHTDSTCKLLESYEWKTKYLMAWREEINFLLNARDIISRNRTIRWIDNVVDSAIFKRRGIRSSKLFSPVGMELQGKERLGMADNNLTSKELLESDSLIFDILGLDSFPGVLFSFLKYYCACPLDLNSNFTSSEQILTKARNRELDSHTGFVLSISAAATFISEGTKQFKPFLLLPQLSQQAMLPKQHGRSKADASKGDWLFRTDPPDFAIDHFNFLFPNKLDQNKRCALHHTDQDEITDIMRESHNKLYGILCFPNYLFNEWFNECVPASGIAGQRTPADVVLFLNVDFVKQKSKARAFEIALRDAWLKIKMGSTGLDKVLTQIIEDSSYLEFLRRWTGLHYIPSRKVAEFLALTI